MIKTKSKNRILKNMLAAIGVAFLSSLPYIHDIITIRGEDIKGWVPDFGLSTWLTAPDGTVLGFSSYRVFIYTFFIHLFAHIGWVGWMLDAKGKSYRFFILVPVFLSGYTVALLLLNARATAFNQAGVKSYITLGLSAILIINFFINRTKKHGKNYNNGTPFNFISGSKKLLGNVSSKVNRFIDNFNNIKHIVNDMLYVIDYEDILVKYSEIGIGDIDEFSANYTFSHHFGKAYDSPERREAMYLKVREYLNKLKTNGEIA